MAGLAMAFDIIARDHASKTFHDVGTAADKTGKQVKSVGEHGSKAGGLMSKGMKVAAVGLAAAGGAAVAFGKSSIDAFTSNTKAAMAMQRAIGGSIEDASRLNFAARESGVGQEVLSKSLRLLEKNIATVAGKAGPGAKALASMGINAKDAHGKIRPMATLLPDIADKFAKMPNGAEKSALALKLFGRGGLEMLPMLNKGKAGMTDLMKESDKFGLTVGNKQVKDMKANIVQQRAWHATMLGLKVQIGAGLLPVITALTGSVRGKLGPAIHGATQFLMDNKDTIANLTAVLIRFLPQILIGVGLFKTITSVVKGFTAAQALLNIVMDANPIGLIVIAIAALAAGLIYAYKNSATFRTIVQAAFENIGKAAQFMWNNAIAPVIRFLISGFSTVMDWIGKMFDLLSNVPGFGWAADLRDKCYTARDAAKDLGAKIKDIPDSHKTNITAPTATAQKDVKDLNTALGRTPDKHNTKVTAPTKDQQKDVKDLRTALGLVPTKHDTKVTAPTGTQQRDVKDLTSTIKKIPGSHNTTITANTKKANADLLAFTKKWTGRSIPLTFDINQMFHVPSGGGIGGPPTGGGPGGGFLNPTGIAPGFAWGHYPSGAVHRALDFPVPIGTPMRAGESGVVMVAGWDTTGFGNVVRTHDQDGNYTIYGHNSRLLVHAGQAVRRGQVLAYSGSTGHSSGPHAHVERRHIMYDPSTSFNFTSQLRAFAKGGWNIPRGWALVGEKGPELAYLPQGSHVLPADQTRDVLNPVTARPAAAGAAATGGGITIQEAKFYGVQDVAAMIRQLQDYANRNGGLRIKIAAT